MISSLYICICSLLKLSASYSPNLQIKPRDRSRTCVQFLQRYGRCWLRWWWTHDARMRKKCYVASIEHSLVLKDLKHLNRTTALCPLPLWNVTLASYEQKTSGPIKAAAFRLLIISSPPELTQKETGSGKGHKGELSKSSHSPPAQSWWLEEHPVFIFFCRSLCWWVSKIIIGHCSKSNLDKLKS